MNVIDLVGRQPDGDAADVLDLADALVGRLCLGVFHEDIEITVIVKDPRVEQLESGLVLAAAPILFDKLLVREGMPGPVEAAARAQDPLGEPLAL
jgi:hypothetical protein